jgi:hypothetical protein
MKVVRVLTYEAVDEATMLRQLAGSLPDGVKEIRDLTIRVETIASDISLSDTALSVKEKVGANG